MKKIKTSKKTLLLLIIVLLALAVIFFFLEKKNDSPRDQDNVSSDDISINYGPPSQEIQKETEDFKKAQESSNDFSGSNQTSVVLTYLYYENDSVYAGGIVNGVFEEGGSCKLTLRKGSLIVTGESTGLTNSKNTSCSQIAINRTKFPESGQWEATLAYESPTAKGISGGSKINVP